jgi:hydroxymethylpyrimidine pyrophosphatase-like HAD family hydrolase
LKKYLFVDLDDTLFSSLPKCPKEQDLHPAAFLKDGSACSFSTPKQRAFLDMAKQGMTLIPATARNSDAFGRVDLPFADYKIINYGGIVLAPDGTPDAPWLHKMRGEMGAALPGLRRAMAIIDAFSQGAGLAGKARLIEDYGIPFYVVVKDRDKVAERLAPIEHDALAPWIAAEGKDFYIHRNGNNLAVLPKALNKAHAVAYVIGLLRAAHGEVLTMGMGDSRSDARFMAACDYAIVPRGTQLAALALETL